MSWGRRLDSGPGGAVGSFGNIEELRAIVDAAMTENSEGKRWQGRFHFQSTSQIEVWGQVVNTPSQAKEKRMDEAKLFDPAASRATDVATLFRR